MEYAGEGNFTFVAIVSKEFWKCYIKLYFNYESSAKDSASDLLEYAKICFVSNNEDFSESIFY